MPSLLMGRLRTFPGSCIIESVAKYAHGLRNSARFLSPDAVARTCADLARASTVDRHARCRQHQRRKEWYFSASGARTTLHLARHLRRPIYRLFFAVGNARWRVPAAGGVSVQKFIPIGRSLLSSTGADLRRSFHVGKKRVADAAAAEDLLCRLQIQGSRQRIVIRNHTRDGAEDAQVNPIWCRQSRDDGCAEEAARTCKDLIIPQPFAPRAVPLLAERVADEGNKIQVTFAWHIPQHFSRTKDDRGSEREPE